LHPFAAIDNSHSATSHADLWQNVGGKNNGTTSEGSIKFRTSEIWLWIAPTVGSSKMIAGDRDNRLSNANPPSDLTLADSFGGYTALHNTDQSDRPPVPL